MASYTRDDAITLVYRMLRDTGNTATEQLLTNTEIGQFVDFAARTYSMIKPTTTVVDSTADGTDTTTLPAGFDVDFSRIVTIESPTGQTPPEFRDPRSSFLYQTPSGWQLKWVDYAPNSGDTVRIAYTTPRVFGATTALTTVADTDFEAVCTLAAARAATAIAGKYGRTNEPILSADTVNYRTKVMDWTSIASKWQKMWEDHAAAIAPPASGWVNWDSKLGVLPFDHLTHLRLRR